MGLLKEWHCPKFWEYGTHDLNCIFLPFCVQTISRLWLGWLSWTDDLDNWRPVNLSLTRCVHVLLYKIYNISITANDAYYRTFLRKSSVSSNGIADIMYVGWESMCKICLWARTELLQGTLQKVCLRTCHVEDHFLVCLHTWFWDWWLEHSFSINTTLYVLNSSWLGVMMGIHMQVPEQTHGSSQLLQPCTERQRVGGEGTVQHDHDMPQPWQWDAGWRDI